MAFPAQQDTAARHPKMQERGEGTAGLTVVVQEPWSAGLTSGSVECGAARGCAAENHGSHSQSGHIYRGSGAGHSGRWRGLTQ